MLVNMSFNGKLAFSKVLFHQTSSVQSTGQVWASWAKFIQVFNPIFLFRMILWMSISLVPNVAHECTTHQIEGKDLFYKLLKFEQVGPNSSWLNHEISKNLASDDALNVHISGSKWSTRMYNPSNWRKRPLLQLVKVWASWAKFILVKSWNQQEPCFGWFFECPYLWFQMKHMNVQPIKLKEKASSTTCKSLSKLGQIHLGKIRRLARTLFQMILWMFTTVVLMGAHECTTTQTEG